MQGMSLSLETLEEKDGNKGRYQVTVTMLSLLFSFPLTKLRASFPFLDQGSYYLQNSKAGLKVTGGVN